PLLADELADHLRPAARRGPQVHDAHARADQVVLLIQLHQLVGRARSIPVLLRLLDEGVAEVSRQPTGAALGAGHFSTELRARIGGFYYPSAGFTGQDHR